MKTNSSHKSILAICMALFTLQVYSQKVYVKLNGDYQIGVSSNGENQNQAGTVTSYEKVKQTSLGKGINLGASVGYMFNEFIGTELNVSYLMGGSSATSNNSTGSSSTNLRTTTHSATMISFTPSLILTPGFSKINPYARIGLLVGIPKITEKVEESFGSLTLNTTNQTTLMTGDVALGFSGGIGVAYQLNEKISLTGEITSSIISYAPTKGEVIASSLNGVDNLSSLSTASKKIEYVDSYTYDSSAPINNDVPQKSIKQNQAFNSIGFSLGLKYNLF